MSEGIRVRATRNGFIGAQLKVIGSEFTLLKPEFFSSTWMQKIDPEPNLELDLEDQDISDESSAELTTRRRRRATQ